MLDVIKSLLNYFTMSLFVTIIVFTVIEFILCQSGSELSRLKTTLFTTNNYNTKIRPVTDQNDVTSVAIDFALVGINSFDDADQKLTTTGYLTVQWTDELLIWTPSDYDNIQSILVPQNEVWKPDITLDNGMESKTSLGQSFIQVTIYANGSVTWSPYEVFHTSCAVDIIHFPFDKQTCDVKFITYMHDDTEVRLQLGTQGFYQSNFEKNGKWDITSMSTSTETNNGKTILNYRLNLQRKSSFYILFLIVPAILLSILNAFVFVLPAGSGEKVGYTIAVFLSYALFYTILSESLPKNSDTVSTIAAYLFFMMFLSTLATIITIIELRIYNKKTRGRLPISLVHFVKCMLFQRCLCKNNSIKDFSADHLDGKWTKVIGPWLDCDWKDFIDALDFILFWIFLVGTIIFTIVALVLASTYVSMF